MNKIKVSGKIKKMNSMPLVTAIFKTQFELFSELWRLKHTKTI